MDDVTRYFRESSELVKLFNDLIEKNKVLKKQHNNNILYEEMHMYDLYLQVQIQQIQFFYPLNKHKHNRRIEFLEMIDLSTKMSFVVLSGFIFETILKKISKQIQESAASKSKNTSNRQGDMAEKFKRVLEFYDIPLNDKLELIRIFYSLRNVLHNMTDVEKNISRTWSGYTYDIKGKSIDWATWCNIICFVNGILDIFQEIQNSKKFCNTL